MDKRRDIWIDTLRGMAAFGVMIAHLAVTFPNVGVRGSGTGKIFVCLFMCITGFYLFADIDEKKWGIRETLLFYVKKGQTILPQFLVCLLLGTLFGLYDMKIVGKTLTFQMGLMHFWYIPVVLGFYLVVPFIRKLLSLFAYEKRIWILVLLIVVIEILFPWYKSSENSIWFWWYIPSFLIGSVTKILVDKEKEQKISYDIVGICFVLIFVLIVPGVRELIFAIPADGYLQNKLVFMTGLWSGIILCIRRSKYLFGLLNRKNFFSFFSKYGYSMYLVHYLILNILLKYGFVEWKLFFITLVLSSISAILLYWMIQKPIILITKDGEKRKKKYATVYLVILIATAVCMYVCNGGVTLTNGAIQQTEESDENWEEYLYVPTMINKFDDTYFIIDCWNSRILYSNQLTIELDKWNVLIDTEYLGGHTVASDGELFVFDNTDMQQILVFKKSGDGFEKVQTISNVCTRPHYVSYDEKTELFYVIGSGNGMLYSYKNENGVLVQNDVVRLEEIKNSYVRSFSICDGFLYTVSGPLCIYQYNISNTQFEKYELVNSYEVPIELAGMNQIYPVEEGFLITVNTGETGSVEETTIVYTSALEKLASGDYIDLYEEMGFVGQPYYITEFDDKYWISEISADKGNGIKSFKMDGSEVCDIETFFYWDEASDVSRERWNTQSSNLSMTTVDLFVFMGQSNMSGKGNAEEAPTVPIGWEYRAISDPSTVYPITEPFGLYENNPNGVNDTTEEGQYRKYGGMVSAFANSYYQTAGVPIIAVSSSEGNSCIDEWLPGTLFYEDSVNRINIAKYFVQTSSNFSLRNVYMVWCQGENDGDRGMDAEEYLQKLNLLADSIVNECGISQVFVVQIGNRADDLNLYQEIQSAQIQVCEESENCTLVSTSFATMAEKGLMIDIYHYTQEGYNIVGTEAGYNAAQYVLQQY